MTSTSTTSPNEPHRLRAWIAVLAGALLLAGCGRQDAPAVSPPPGDTAASAPRELIFGRGADSVSLDPAAITDGESVKVCTNLYEGLVAYAPTSVEIVPCLATSWKTSDDGLVYTFDLRAGVTFHDGTPLDAAAVVNAFQRQADPAHPHHFGQAYVYYESMFKSVIDSVTAPAANQVVITLKSPHAPFLVNLAMFPVTIPSPTALGTSGKDFGLHPVGTGPYRFVSWQREDEIVLEAYPGYWGKAPAIARVKFLAIKENSNRLLRAKSGELHLMDGLSFDHIGDIAGTPSLELRGQEGMNVAYLSLNHTKKPFDDVRVRRAVCHAIRKDVLVADGYDGHAVVARTPLPPCVPGHHAELTDYAHDPARARALLEEAGLGDGFDADLAIMDNPRAYMPDPARVAQYLKADLAAVGIRVRIVTSSWPQHLKATQGGEHTMALMGWIGDNGDADNFLHVLLDKDNATPGSASNISFYKSDRLHEVLIAAQKIVDPARRVALYREAQEIIHEDVGFVPLAHCEDVIVLSKKITGFDLHPTGTLRLASVRWASQ